MDGQMANGAILAAIMMLLIVLPIYCCQVSNEEYEDIVQKIKASKSKERSSTVGDAKDKK